MKRAVKLAAAVVVLGGISIWLESTGLGFIPVPTNSGVAEIVQVPTILGAVLGGPILGAIVGAVYGAFSYLQSTNPFFIDPVIAVVPGLLVGILSYGAYRGGKSIHNVVGLLSAGIVGILTSKVFVLGIAALKGYLPFQAALNMFIDSAVPDLIVSTAFVVVCGILLQRLQKGSITYTRVYSRDR